MNILQSIIYKCEIMLNPESEILNFNEICRGCMCRKQNMKPIFGTYLDEMFCSIVQIKVNTRLLSTASQYSSR